MRRSPGERTRGSLEGRSDGGPLRPLNIRAPTVDRWKGTKREPICHNLVLHISDNLLRVPLATDQCLLSNASCIPVSYSLLDSAREMHLSPTTLISPRQVSGCNELGDVHIHKFEPCHPRVTLLYVTSLSQVCSVMFPMTSISGLPTKVGRA